AALDRVVAARFEALDIGSRGAAAGSERVERESQVALVSADDRDRLHGTGGGRCGSGSRRRRGCGPRLRGGAQLLLELLLQLGLLASFGCCGLGGRLGGGGSLGGLRAGACAGADPDQAGRGGARGVPGRLRGTPRSASGAVAAGAAGEAGTSQSGAPGSRIAGACAPARQSEHASLVGAGELSG